MSFAVLWIAFEWFQANVPVISFPWLSLSTTALDTPIAKLARVGGGALAAFTLVFVSGCLYLFAKKTLQGEIRLNIKSSIAVLVLFVIFFSLADVKIEKPTENTSIAVVQGNDKNRYLTENEIQDEYLEKSHIKLAKSIEGKKDIIVFPESAFDDDIESDSQLFESLKPIAAKTNRLLIANSIAQVDKGDVNRNYFYSPEMDLLGTYDKKRLVPFGEYVPFEKVIGSWSIFDPIGSGFVPGTNDKTIEGVTTLICFESVFTNDVKKALTDESELLVITTNNRSYRRTGNSEQHLDQTRMRSIEFGLPSVQASVSGKSALISASGDVIGKTDLFVNEVLEGELTLGKPNSIYAKTGDWLSLLAVLVVVLLALNNLRKRSWKSRTLKD